MDINLKKILLGVFNLTEKEFHIDLTKEDISCWDSLKHMDLVTTLCAVRTQTTHSPQ